MALYDNRHWLLSHIKNSFISSDDTGMCEAVIIDDIPKDSRLFGEHDKYPNFEDSSEDDDDINNSQDIYADSDCGAHRYRTNTAQRLAKMELEMKKAAKIVHVKWETPPVAAKISSEPAFERKEVKPITKPQKSLLSQQLEDCPVLRRNPFAEFAKFGGSSQMGVPTRTYKVFMTMLPLPERDYPLTVCLLSTARIFELIGYICWKYTTENADEEFQLKENVSRYRLYIAEEDGEVDWDFTSLDPKETVGKFGLAHLALVEVRGEDPPQDIVLEEPAPSQFRRPVRPSEHTLEGDDLRQIKGDLTAIEALLYQSFQVQIISKMRTRTDIVLGINGDKMEIDPVMTSSKVGGKMWRHKSASYEMDDIVFCYIAESRTSGRASFRIVRRTAVVEEANSAVGTSGGAGAAAVVSPTPTSTFKNMDFEGETKTAEEIVKKINLILHLKSSVYRREYLMLREKKPGRRRSFSIWR